MHAMACSNCEIWTSLGLLVAILFIYLLLMLPSTTSSSGHILFKVMIFHSMPKVLVIKSVCVNMLSFLFNFYRAFLIMIQVCCNNLFSSTYGYVHYYVIYNLYE